MAKVGLFKAEDGRLYPASEKDKERLKRWKTGDYLAAQIRKPRNVQFHKKFFALINLVFDNQERYDSKKHFLNEIKIRIGHCETHISTDGKISYIPKSISFEAMDEVEFNEFYNRAVDVIHKHFLPVTGSREMDRLLRQEISQF